MSTNCACDNMILKILIVSRLLFISFFQRSLIAISNDFIFYTNDIRFAKIIIFMILNSSRIVVYEARHYLSIKENCKNHSFTYNIILHAILKLISFHLIEDSSRTTV